MSQPSPHSALLLLVAPYLLLAVGLAQNARERPPEGAEAAKVESAIPVARDALPQLRPLVNQETYKQLGFGSPDEINRATLGTPLPVYVVPLDQLKSSTEQTKPEALLQPTNEAVFPVRVGNEVRTGMRLRNVEGRWRFSAFGASEVFKALDQATKVAGARPHALAGSRFVVTVPVFHLYFIGQREPEGLTLTPTAIDSRFKLKPGESVPASQVFAELIPYAKSYKAGEHLVD